MSTAIGVSLADSRAGAALAPGTRIAFADGRQALRERVRLSSGTRPVRDDAALAGDYGVDALVPLAPWRAPSDTELVALSADGADQIPWRPGCDAALVRLPGKLITPLMDMLDRHEVRDRGDKSVFHGNIAGDPVWSRTLAALREYLTSFALDKIGGLPLSIGPANRFTLTKDSFAADAQKFIGLHLDSWDKLPLRHRHRSRNRVCINLGREARYSLFVNMSLMQMFGHLGLRDPEDVYADYRGLYVGRRFMETCPAYPVVRLRVEPGEAYILPTDNLIHDGSTMGTSHPDVTMTFIGRFGPGPAVVP
jgi:hypothetical protein